MTPACPPHYRRSLLSKPSSETAAARICPEAELLLRCARTRLLPGDADRIRGVLRGELDPEYLLALARLHRVRPLLYWQLHTHCREEIPGALLAQLKESFYANVAHNLYLTAELLHLLDQLDRQGISAVPFKGPVLATSIYGNTMLREAGDLDLLVQKRDVLRGRDVLLSLGYLPRVNFSAAQEAEQLRSSHQYGFVREDRRVEVELQWGVTRSFLSSPLDAEGLWERLQTVSLGGTSVPTLAPEDLLLLLCVHGAKHCWSRLAWICDIAELIRAHPELDWETILEQATARGGRRMLLLGVRLAHDLLGAPLPAHPAALVRADRTAKALATSVRDRLFPEPHELVAGTERSAVYTMQFNLASRERLRDKMRCFTLLIAPGARDEALLPLPGRFALLHYVLRPLRLLRQYGFPRSQPGRQGGTRAWL